MKGNYIIGVLISLLILWELTSIDSKNHNVQAVLRIMLYFGVLVLMIALPFYNRLSKLEKFVKSYNGNHKITKYFPQSTGSSRSFLSFTTTQS